jgi:hypothetical protein
MPDLMKDYIRFPTVEHFVRFLYAVAYSTNVPAHIKLKRSDILIWRDYRKSVLRVSLSQPIYSGIIQQFLSENETVKVFRPYSYYVLQHHRETNCSDQLFVVHNRIAEIHLDDPSKLNRASQILKDYLYYTTFTQSLDRHSHHNRKTLMDGLEAVQGYY